MKGIPKYWFLAAFTLKVFAAFAFWLIYTYYYTERANADIFKYFDDAEYLFESTKGDLISRLKLLLGTYPKDADNLELLKGTLHWDKSDAFLVNDNRTMIRTHLILYHLSGGYFHFHSLFFALLSFMGSFGVFIFFKEETKLNTKLIFLISFAIPSPLFWASAPLKETYLLLALGVFLMGISKTLRNVNFKNASFLLIGTIGLLSVKSYFFISLFTALLFFILSRFFAAKYWKSIFFGLHAALIIALISVGDKIVSILSSKQLAFKFLADSEGAKSVIQIPEFHDILSMIMALPKALFNVLLRPLVPINFSPFSLMSSFEHLIYLLLLITPLFFRRKMEVSEQRVVLFSLSFVLTASAVIGLTTPVMGAIVRYKSPLLPFYLILLFIFVDFFKLKHLRFNR